MDARLAKITPGRKARFAGKDLQTLPSGTDSIIYILLTCTSTVEQCRLRQEVTLEKNIQEVMLALTRQEAKRKERSPTR